MQSAAKVGALVIAFVVLLLGAYSIIGKALFREPVQTYYADFEDAGGTRVGTEVLMAGVPVGTVTDVELKSPKLARLTMQVKDDAKLPAGSTALIPGSLLNLGEGIVQIETPAGPVTSYLPEGAVLQGRKQGALENILPNGEETTRELTRTLAAVRKLLEDQELQQDVKELLKTTNTTLERVGDLTAETQGVVAENRTAIRRALGETTLAMENVRVASEQVSRILQERELEGRAVALLDRMNELTERTSKLVGDVNELVNDPEVRNPLKATLANTQQITERGVKIAENAEIVSNKAVELSGAVEKTLEDVRGFLGRGNRPRPLGISASMDLLRQTEDDYWRTDVVFSRVSGESGYYLGMYDAFESNRIIAQLGRKAAPDLFLRYGIYAAKPGVGVDYALTDRFHLRGDLFDINDPTFNLRARIQLGNGLYGWAGYDRIFGDPTPVIGIGVQK